MSVALGVLGIGDGPSVAAAPLSRFAPEFELKLNGQAIPAALRANITSIRYEDGMNAADRVEVSIANTEMKWLQEHIRGLGFRPYPTGMTLGPITKHWWSGPLFDMDNKLELSMGYAGHALEPMFEGNITGIQASFPNGGMPTLTLVAHDRLERLSRGTYSRGFGPVPDAVVALLLAAENWLLPQIDAAVVGSSTGMAALNGVFSGGAGPKQKGQSDLKLLKEIAEQYCADFWVDGSTLYLSRFMFREYSPRLTMKWGESLHEFIPKVTVAGAVVGVALRVNLREIPLAFLIRVFWDLDRETLGLTVVPAQGAKSKKALGNTWTFFEKPIKSVADIANSALALTNELKKRLNSRLTGSASSLGDPRIRAGAVVRLEGMGPDFSQDYRVTSATHTIDANGYRTTFEVAKEIIP
jgi:phage protein D